ncbi:hypothetical protein [Halolamina salina]|uniref:Uncharacterized protein n=1 Tax=Halolamina salina TaxID=1220023 RepID=A0ABD6B9T4_9EURY
MPPSEITAFRQTLRQAEEEDFSRYHKCRETLQRVGSTAVVNDDTLTRSWMQHVKLLLELLNTWATDRFQTQFRRRISEFIQNDESGQLGETTQKIYSKLPENLLESILLKGIDNLQFSECIIDNSASPDPNGFSEAVSAGLSSFVEERQSNIAVVTLEVYTLIAEDLIPEIDAWVGERVGELMDLALQEWDKSRSETENWTNVLAEVDILLGKWDGEVRYLGDR